LEADMAKARKTTARTPPIRTTSTAPAIAAEGLLADLRALIESTREQTARAVNSALAGLY
jgi:hypothetical protein